MEEVVKIYPFSPSALFQLGRLYFNNNQIEEAISQFKKAIAIFPEYSNAHYSLATAYTVKGERELAIKEFEKVLELNPGNEDVLQKIQELKSQSSGQ